MVQQGNNGPNRALQPTPTPRSTPLFPLKGPGGFLGVGVSCRALKATKGCTFCMGEWFEQIRLKKAPSSWVKAIDEHQKAILARAIDEHQKAKEDEAI